MGSRTERNSLSPEHNPLAHLIRHEDDILCPGLTGNEETLAPDQRPSIINEQAVVRYFKDPSKRPEVLSIRYSETSPIDQLQGEDCGRYEVCLSLNVTKGCGGRIWPAAEVLGQYIASKRNNERWTGKIAVELGAGTGLVGLLAAKATNLREVWLTDQEVMLKLMEKNRTLNAKVAHKCFITELNWGMPLPKDIIRRPDVLLLADCVYIEAAFQLLVDTLMEISSPETEILFCYQQRRKADRRFFNLLKKHFAYSDVEDDDQERQIAYNREGTRLYRVQKKL